MTLIGVLISSLLTADVTEPRLNFVILFADDLGYGDLGCYGHPTIRTPNLDRMAAEGLRFTQFYSAAPVCTPSRAALLTARLPLRSGLTDDNHRVLFPNSAGGIPDEELTLAEALKPAGYATGCVGKWHLGHLPRYLPTRHGFDEYFGIPYSNDMFSAQRGYPPVPLLRGEKTIEQPVEQSTLTRRYTDEAIDFVRRHKDRPFLLYVPHTFPHVPLFASDEFRGKSKRGLYGDVVEELDHNVGRLLDAIRDLGLAQRTIVWFTSDNGPWLTQDLRGGSAGLLRDGKGSTWEGGMREPAIAWGPGTIPAGRSTHELASTLDLLPTCLAFAGVGLPTEHEIDGYDLTPVLKGTGPSPRKTMYYYRGTRLMAVRKGPWKAHLMTQPAYGKQIPITKHDPPLLYHLERDPAESYNAAADNPEVVSDLLDEVRSHQSAFKPGKPQLDALIEGAVGR